MKIVKTIAVFINEVFEPSERPFAKEVDAIFSRTPEQALRGDIEKIGMDFYTAMDKLKDNATKVKTSGSKSSAQKASEYSW